MKTVNLLDRIADGEMEGSIFCVKGDFFYNLIVIDGSLYVLNKTAKKLELLDNKYISRFISDDIELLRLDIDEKEEKKKIPKKLETLNANYHSKEVYYENYSKEEISLDIETLQHWVNEIIDHLKSKGE